MKIKITGSGSYIPEIKINNTDFSEHHFMNEDGSPFGYSNDIVIGKFKGITGIEERRYAEPNIVTSDMAYLAAEKAIINSGIDSETLDYIIVAHNFGDIKNGTIQSDAVPCLAARVKHKLQIQNPKCVAFDILFGCPGWIEGMLQAYSLIKSGMAKKCLVIGAESLSRVIDPYDRDSMIFSDGAGAAVIELVPGENAGVLSFSTQSHCAEEMEYLNLGQSNFPESDPRIRYIKMKGRKVYEYAIKNVPIAMKDCIDKAGITIKDIKKIFIHQANEKLDEAIVRELFKLYGLNDVPVDLMPMNIQKLGNSSVATIPTLYTMVKNGEIEGFDINEGDIVLFASVGAGMNINAMCYKV